MEYATTKPSALFEKKWLPVPENNLTKGQRDFIGTVFENKKGNTITVKECVLAGKSAAGNNVYKYVCECSECSKDEELWPYGSIIGHKYDMISDGTFGCGCSYKPWDEWQNLIRCKRVCDDSGWVFIGYASEYKKYDTDIVLYEPTHDYTWTAKLKNVFRGFGRDNYLKGKFISLEDETHISNFMATGSYLDGTKFTKLDTYRWEYTCPVCSQDEYVQAGVCSGVFEISSSSARQGNKACRCSPSYKWNHEQRDYKIKDICNKEGLIFIGWEERYKSSENSYFNWVCSCGGDNRSNCHSFLKGHRCKHCCTNPANGFYDKKSRHVDYLYILNFDNNFIKVGRTFNLDRRLDELRYKSGVSNITILALYTMKHIDIYSAEQDVLEYLRQKGYQKQLSWTNECFNFESLEEAVDKVETFNLTKVI